MTQAQLERELRELRALVSQLSIQLQQQQRGASRNSAAPDVLIVPPSGPGGVAPGQSLPPNPSPMPRYSSPAILPTSKGNFIFGPGFELRTDDEEFILQFHNLTQFDYRGYQQSNQNPVHDTFAFPRQWWMFSGRISKPIGFFTSIADGFTSVNLLDAFLDFDFNTKFRMRVGRFKTPFTYEFFVEPIQGLVIPERSVFFNNFGQNRDLGIMPFGRILNGTLDYAGGIFNGTRNGYLARGDSKFTSWFVNWRPFGNRESSLFENFNIGGSVFAGNNNSTAPIPSTLYTIVPINSATNDVIGVPFLAYNSNVKMSGPMAFWDLHAAYFYKGWEVIGEWGSGFQDYTGGNSYRTRLPVESFYVQTSYLITGENRSSIGIVKPINPVSFGRGKGWQGTGAIEPFFRYEYLDIGSQVFTQGLADPNLYANRMYQTHVGANWHMTQWVKMYFDWIHAEFNQPVLYATGKRQLTSDMFLLRFQLFF